MVGLRWPIWVLGFRGGCAVSEFWVVVVLRVWWLWVWICRRGFVVVVALVVADLVGCCLLWVGCDLQVLMVGGCWNTIL